MCLLFIHSLHQNASLQKKAPREYEYQNIAHKVKILVIEKRELIKTRGAWKKTNIMSHSV